MQVSFLHPLDQPLANKRLLEEIRQSLQSPYFNRLCIAVAAVSQGSLLRLDTQIQAWRAVGKTIEAIYGVDIGATTVEGLNYSLANFNAVYIARIPGVKFHPKVYTFSGPQHARVYLGSHNFTVPGTETNLESSVRIDYSLPADAADFAQAQRGWTDLLAQQASSTVFPLNAARVGQLVAEGFAIRETELRRSQEGGKGLSKAVSTSALPRSTIQKRPPSALPAAALTPPAAPAAAIPAAGGAGPGPVAAPIAAPSADVLVMQIRVHHNGEVFLSKRAIDQNPAFFGFPFTGLTVPKKPGNPQYPQRVPDPVVDITVIGAGGAILLNLAHFNLNTVYYSTKSEIRVTCSQLVGVMPDYSVMVMRQADPITGLDYDIEIHTPQGPSYGQWLNACNQTMPGGGQAPRRFGWL